MRLKIPFIASLLLVLTFATYAQTPYIEKYRPLADSLAEVYQIPAKVILGIAVIESSAGTSRNAKLLNNHFGIVGKNSLLKTKGIKTMYKEYPSARDSYIGFVKLISSKKYYNEIKGEKSPAKWVDVISRHGYSVQPESWRKVIMKSISRID